MSAARDPRQEAVELLGKGLALGLAEGRGVFSLPGGLLLVNVGRFWPAIRPNQFGGLVEIG